MKIFALDFLKLNPKNCISNSVKTKAPKKDNPLSNLTFNII